jgi:hypothetical protein
MTDKISVETTGDFSLWDISTGDSVEATGASLVTDSRFIRDRIELGQLRLSGEEGKPQPAPVVAVPTIVELDIVPVEPAPVEPAPVEPAPVSKPKLTSKAK